MGKAKHLHLVSEALLDSCVVCKSCDLFKVRNWDTKDRKAGRGNTKALNRKPINLEGKRWESIFLKLLSLIKKKSTTLVLQWHSVKFSNLLLHLVIDKYVGTLVATYVESCASFWSTSENWVIYSLTFNFFSCFVSLKPVSFLALQNTGAPVSFLQTYVFKGGCLNSAGNFVFLNVSILVFI